MSSPQPAVPMAAQPHAPPQTSLPGTAMAAAILWILYGALGLLGGLAILELGGSAYFQIIFGLAFLITGIQVLTGTTSSILGAGITCIILGCVTLYAFMSLLSAMGQLSGLIPGWVLSIVYFNSGILILAGILACVSNTKFKAWRAYTKSQKANAPHAGA